ncbi:MAG: hypothetical protein RBS99_10535 [Rhodospirillales bacterium]|jgi:hypothetical protein|nr:hypothetical protein [Rhodospirillales bacterium]
MIIIDDTLTPGDLAEGIDRLWRLSGTKIRRLAERWDPADGAPVFTVEGRYVNRGWTEWTQGFVYGAGLLQFDATGDEWALEFGRTGTREHMGGHVTHVGVHDHGFNCVSTYGNLRRLMAEGRLPENADEKAFLDMALASSGAVQAARWTDLGGGRGYIPSFNGPHSLFVDTMRSLRSLAVAHLLGRALKGEHDQSISLLDRLAAHAAVTAETTVFFGKGRDAYDEWGRTCHEAVFNVNDGLYRCPSSQQGYSPFTTWTRGQAWITLGYAEQLEFFQALKAAGRPEADAYGDLVDIMTACAQATADHYIANTPTDGVCYWDTGAPGLAAMPGHRDRPADPYNDHEPVDSSGAAIMAQGLLRLASVLENEGEAAAARRYRQAGLTIARSLLTATYLSEDEDHEGLLLNAIYHRPNGWDHVPSGRKVPCGESCQWGDYHFRELALMIARDAAGEAPYRFFTGLL